MTPDRKADPERGHRHVVGEPIGRDEQRGRRRRKGVEVAHQHEARGNGEGKPADDPVGNARAHPDELPAHAGGELGFVAQEVVGKIVPGRHAEQQHACRDQQQGQRDRLQQRGSRPERQGAQNAQVRLEGQQGDRCPGSPECEKPQAAHQESGLAEMNAQQRARRQQRERTREIFRQIGPRRPEEKGGRHRIPGNVRHDIGQRREWREKEEGVRRIGEFRPARRRDIPPQRKPRGGPQDEPVRSQLPLEDVP